MKVCWAKTHKAFLLLADLVHRPTQLMWSKEFVGVIIDVSVIVCEQGSWL